MKISRYVICAVFLFIVYVLDVNASCSDSTLKALKEKASSVKVTYQYNEEYEKLDYPVFGSFNLYITGLSDDVYAYDYESLTNYYVMDAKDGVVTVKDVNGGDRKIYIMSNNKDCKGKLIDTVVVNVPKFNYYAVSKYCVDIDSKEFVYCDKWYQASINKNTFLKELEIYKAKKANSSDEPVKPSDDNNADNTDNAIKLFFKNHYIEFTGGVVAVVLVLIYFISRKKRGDL